MALAGIVDGGVPDNEFSDCSSSDCDNWNKTFHLVELEGSCRVGVTEDLSIKHTFEGTFNSCICPAQAVVTLLVNVGGGVLTFSSQTAPTNTLILAQYSLSFDSGFKCTEANVMPRSFLRSGQCCTGWPSELTVEPVDC